MSQIGREKEMREDRWMAMATMTWARLDILSLVLDGEQNRRVEYPIT